MIKFEEKRFVARRRVLSLAAILLIVSGFLSFGDAIAAPNIMVIVGDDMGVETLSCYGLNDDTAVKPTLDNLCAHGIRFDNMWSQPVCSPTRATVMKGRYGFRTGPRGRPAHRKICQDFKKDSCG